MYIPMHASELLVFSKSLLVDRPIMSQSVKRRLQAIFKSIVLFFEGDNNKHDAQLFNLISSGGYCWSISI